MRAVLTIAMLVLFGAQGLAQGVHGKQPPKGLVQTEMQRKQLSDARKKKQHDADKAYKQSLDKIPDQKTFDPWAKMR